MVMQTTTLYDFFAPMWVELSFLVFFALGFLFLRFDSLFRSHPKSRCVVDDTQSKLRKKLEADVSSGHSHSAVEAWRAVRSQGPTQVETLKIVVQALASSEPEALHEVVDHIAAHPTILSCPRVATAVLDIVARNGHVRTMEELSQIFRQKMRISRTPQTYEVLLGGYASVGDEKKVQELCNEVCAANQKLTARGYSLTIKGFLKNAMVDAALQHIQEMKQQGFYVPSFAVTQLFRAACDAGRAEEVLDIAQDQIMLPAAAQALGLRPF